MIERKVLVNKDDDSLLDIILIKGDKKYILEGCMLWEDEEDNNEMLFLCIEEEVKNGEGEWVVYKENEMKKVELNIKIEISEEKYLKMMEILNNKGLGEDREDLEGYISDWLNDEIENEDLEWFEWWNS
jgi:hypothetical protein